MTTWGDSPHLPGLRQALVVENGTGIIKNIIVIKTLGDIDIPGHSLQWHPCITTSDEAFIRYVDVEINKHRWLGGRVTDENYNEIALSPLVVRRVAELEGKIPKREAAPPDLLATENKSPINTPAGSLKVGKD